MNHKFKQRIGALGFPVFLRKQLLTKNCMRIDNNHFLVKSIFLYIFLVSSHSISAQAIDNPIDDNNTSFVTRYIPNVTPSEVEAFKFRTYGNIEANLASGTPAVSIPLYTLEDQGVSIPITLNYDATGIKVTDVSGPVGLKWTLSAGGTINRSINTKADEVSSGWLTFIQNEDMSNLRTSVNSRFSDYRDQDPKSVRFINRVLQEYDYAPDHYNIGVPGLSGNFSFDQNGKPIFLERATPYKLNFDINRNEFNLRNQQGVQYLFGNNRDVTYYNTNLSSNNIAGYTGGNTSVITMDGGGQNIKAITAFLLNEIKTPNNQPLFKFNYNTTHDYNIINYKAGYAYQRSAPLQEGDCPFAQEKMLQIQSNSFETNIVTSITGRKEEISFIYETIAGKDTQERLREIIIKSNVTNAIVSKIELQYHNYTGSNKFGLKKVLFKSPTNLVNNQYTFQYMPGEIPNANSNAKDINGYYNGATTNDLYDVDKDFTNLGGAVFNTANFPEINGNRKINHNKIKHGILQEIIYPTGGKTVFEYYIPSNSSNLLRTSGLFLRATYDIDETGKKKFNKQYTYTYTTSNNGAPSGTIDEISSELSPNCPNSHFFTDDITDDRNRRNFKNITVKTFNENDQLQWTEDYKYAWAYDFPYLIESKTYSPQKEILQIQKYELEKSIGVISYVAGSREEIDNRFSMRVSTKSYPSIFYRKTEEVNTEVFADNSVFNQTKMYKYDDRYLVNEVIITLQNGEESIHKTYYPYTSSAPISTNLKNKMLEINQLVPVKTENSISKDNTIVTNQSTVYNFKEWTANHILPESIRYQKNEDIANDDRVHYYDYDLYGNPLEVSQTDGSHILYIWGYNDQHPIAKIANASYIGMPSTVRNLINQIKTDSNRENSRAKEAALRTKLKQLQSHSFFANAQMSYYTYDPLIGVTSMTDPRGYTMTYHYDNFNRLEQVKDQDGNIVSENEYHYKNN